MARLRLAQPPRLARPSATHIPRFLAPAAVQARQASVGRRKKTPKKKKRVDFKRYDLDKRNFPRFTLHDAMRCVVPSRGNPPPSPAVRILRAVEVGQPPTVKYELHINLKAVRGGPIIKGTIRLPHPVQSDWRIAVLCPEGGEIAAAAAAAGAVTVGEQTLLEDIRQGKIIFDRLLCHESSEQALNKSGLARVLGPKGLMPNRKMRTIVTDVAKSIRDSAGAADLRERLGVVRLAVGQLSHSPEQLKANLSAVLKKVKSEAAAISEESTKAVHEVILSTTHGPGLSLNGKVAEATDVPAEHLSNVM